VSPRGLSLQLAIGAPWFSVLWIKALLLNEKNTVMRVTQYWFRSATTNRRETMEIGDHSHRTICASIGCDSSPLIDDTNKIPSHYENFDSFDTDNLYHGILHLIHADSAFNLSI
jgi:hypothetical protein